MQIRDANGRLLDLQRDDFIEGGLGEWQWFHYKMLRDYERLLAEAVSGDWDKHKREVLRESTRRCEARIDEELSPELREALASFDVSKSIREVERNVKTRVFEIDFGWVHVLAEGSDADGYETVVSGETSLPGAFQVDL